MGMKDKSADEPDVAAVVGDIVQEAEKLLTQHVSLLRAEVQQEFHQAKAAAVSMGAGVGLVATGGILSTLMVVHGLHRATRIPLWGCYGLVGGLAGAVGVGLLAEGKKRAANVRLVPPPQITEALKEDVTWLKKQTKAVAT